MRREIQRLVCTYRHFLPLRYEGMREGALSYPPCLVNNRN